MAADVSYLIPYFTDWRVSNHLAWPDGKARFYQPCKLAEAFDFLNELLIEAINEQQSPDSARNNHQGDGIF